ncbi:hypothetical protein KOI35_22800 [Actinoplanes bogorensis]|uniref:Uncharacterized protein n=1 Tax=Paractinoplanes bogorensis TaxID=1610840 RepID=A0ABS5YTE2_9ACTN|nr:hypothetical protein [Actinoplanes bogorensis]MBU2666336.1 hypothetical protein [Actinoplanes bogorensis]
MKRTLVLSVRWLLLTAHAAALAPALWVWVTEASAAFHTGPDLNISAAVYALYLGFLGLPWTLPFVAFDIGRLPDPLQDVVVVGFAVLNFALHATLVVRRTARPRPAAESVRHDG